MLISNTIYTSETSDRGFLSSIAIYSSNGGGRGVMMVDDAEVSRDIVLILFVWRSPSNQQIYLIVRQHIKCI